MGKKQRHDVSFLVHFTHKHWNRQPFAYRLARQELALALRHLPALAVVLRMGVGEETGPQEHLVNALKCEQLLP